MVDNNSCDQTLKVVDHFCSMHSGLFRYVFESKPGKSHALNLGIQEARGDVLAFVDDDVTVEPTWLRNLTSALAVGPWAGAGGRILPNAGFSAPRWLDINERYSLAPLALFDLGPDSGPLSESPFGTNMAFKKEMFEKHGNFRTDLGPRPGSQIRNEDTEFGGRLLAAGERLLYEPSAIVYHPISDNRLNRKYFLDWWFGKGQADARQFGNLAGARLMHGRIQLRLFRALGFYVLAWMFTFKPSRRFSRKMKVWGTLGNITEACRPSNTKN